MTKTKLTLYVKPTCTTCRKAMHLLKQKGVPYKEVRYFETPLTQKKLKELLAKMGLSARELLRKDKMYKELGLDQKELSEKELIKLMVKHPDLMQRPIAERGDRAILARPVEKLEAFLE